MNGHTSQALSVSAVAKFVYSIISQNITPLWIRGEISNLKIHQNGNVYFNIKDNEAKLNAIIMSDSPALKNASVLRDGIEIVVHGRISYYKKEGYISLFIDEVELIGEGILKQKFDELKNRLEKEGLFAREHKRKIPEYPQCVGVVTSGTGAAIRDILNVINRRFSGVRIILFPAAVQGETAVNEIVNAIRAANDFASDFLDVLIVGRGGGSLEDLWCFNEEATARAIYSSKIPVISAVGHEIDYTIADYVADLRAPTPSAAAELVVKDKKDILNRISSLKDRIGKLLEIQLDYLQNFLEIRGKNTIERLFRDQLSDLSLTLENLSIRFTNNFTNYLSAAKKSVDFYQSKLKTLHPYNTLKRGYSITELTDASGSKKVVTSKIDVSHGDKVTTKVYDGSFDSIVQS